MVERVVAFEQFGSAAFDDPADRGLRKGLTEGASDRDAVNDVAESGEADDENARRCAESLVSVHGEENTEGLDVEQDKLGSAWRVSVLAARVPAMEAVTATSLCDGGSRDVSRGAAA